MMRSSPFSNVSQPSRSRASVADECFGIFKIKLVLIFKIKLVLIFKIKLVLIFKIKLVLIFKIKLVLICVSFVACQGYFFV